MEKDLPPGFRFHPTDEELIVYYLLNQCTPSNPSPASIIPEVNIYKFDPWDLPDKVGFGEKERYFFTPRDRKYPNGVRPNRATVSGYWKATGTDKAIYRSGGSKLIGLKKALVFYKGKPLKGTKTGWIMHEYRLVETRTSQANQHVGSMRLDDWVLCRIYKKKNLGKTIMEEKQEFPSGSNTENFNETATGNNYHHHHQNEQETMNLLLPRTFDNYLMGSSSSVSQIFSNNGHYNSTFNVVLHQNQALLTNSSGIDYSLVKPQILQSSSMNNSNNNQPMFTNHVYDL